MLQNHLNPLICNHLIFSRFKFKIVVTVKIIVTVSLYVCNKNKASKDNAYHAKVYVVTETSVGHHVSSFELIYTAIPLLYRLISFLVIDSFVYLFFFFENIASYSKYSKYIIFFQS